MTGSAEDVREHVREYVRTTFLFNPSQELSDSESLLGTGILDSTGVLELIGHLEATYDIKFADNELVAKHFDSIDKITEFMKRKLGR